MRLPACAARRASSRSRARRNRLEALSRPAQPNGRSGLEEASRCRFWGDFGGFAAEIALKSLEDHAMDGNLLIQFRVENHRSLRDEQTLSLVATTTKAENGAIHVDGFSENILPVVAIYGANASGKSNVLAALDLMRRAIVDSQRRWEPLESTPQEPFLLSDKQRQSSLYETEMLISGIRYRYGFLLSADRIEEEWLYSWPHGKKTVLFTRDGSKFDFGKNLHG